MSSGNNHSSESENNRESSWCPSRREALKTLVGLPALGAVGAAGAGLGAGFLSHEERHLLAEEAGSAQGEGGQSAPKPDGRTGATRTSWELPKIDELKAKVPHTMLGGLEVSRIIMGGNLIGGWAHSRDLIYVSELVKNYHTKEKVFQTFKLAEECGINTFSGNPVMQPMLEEYWGKWNGKIQFISDCGGQLDIRDGVKRAIDFGCDACYMHGGVSDYAAANGDFKLFEDCFQIMRDAGYPAGMGAHHQSTIDRVVEAGLMPDFFMKTFHHTDYWSAHAQSENDNIFCREPDATREFMAKNDKPWIAFKVLAAGAIHPEVGFRFALEGGADFLCVGMYDFQMVYDVNLFCDIFKNIPARTRRMLPEVPVEPAS